MKIQKRAAQAAEAVRLGKFGKASSLFNEALAMSSHDRGTVVDVFRRALVAEALAAGISGAEGYQEFRRLMDYAGRWGSATTWMLMAHEASRLGRLAVAHEREKSFVSQLKRLVVDARPQGMPAKHARLWFAHLVWGHPAPAGNAGKRSVSSGQRTSYYLAG